MKPTSIKSRKSAELFEPRARAPKGPKHLALIALLFLGSFLVTTLVMVFERNRGLDMREFAVGQPAPRTLFSPMEITYVDEDETQRLRDEKSRAVAPVFTFDPSQAEAMRRKSEDFFAALQTHREKSALGEKTDPSALPLAVAEPSLKWLIKKETLADVREQMALVIDKTRLIHIAAPEAKSQLTASGTEKIAVVNAATQAEGNVLVQKLFTPGEGYAVAEALLDPEVGRNRGMKSAVQDILQTLLSANLSEDARETDARREKAAESVAAIEGQVQEGELIVQRGMLITPKSKQRLLQIQKKLAEQKVFQKLLAVGVLVLFVYGLCFVYLFFFEKEVLFTWRLLLLLHTIYLSAVVLCKVAAVWPGSSFYLMPVALASVLLTLLTGPGTGFLTAAVMAAFAAPLALFAPDVILMTLFSSVAGTFAALHLRKRMEFLKLGAMVGLAAAVVIFIYQVFGENPVQESFQVSALGLANGFLITMPLAFLLLPLLEWVFDMTTDITLLELSDLNHPLLRRMIVEAPGTYHHSLVVSTLAESACEAIGANALLARVGCYFHDIGKIARAEFFTENDRGGNRHEKLTPTMSCLVIMNHVKDGIELGRRYKLKERILRFIPEHQGTGVVFYFYKKALDQAAPGQRVDPNDFRYPGPKPQSRETAVALLSDSTEAASRSLKEPSHESIRQLVRKIINDKFIDGQLDECDLTLRDLHRIQESFVHNLMAIFHTRVKYPNPRSESDDAPDLFQEGQFDKFRLGLKRPNEPS